MRPPNLKVIETIIEALNTPIAVRGAKKLPRTTLVSSGVVIVVSGGPLTGSESAGSESADYASVSSLAELIIIE